ncbi:MAG: D-arabinose 5-phosphate isomerase [Flavobacteriales bacterium]|mgnify:CR=1 FL=1|nr:D-arabinose 5-phosphate isomerase [Flavobacteriales bacterium]
MKNDIDIIQIGKDLITDESNALIKLRDRIDSSFTSAVNLISSSKGRVIIIGLGKSGIIGRKIAATLNSTGTIASFIHASDALHGDAGNINSIDVILFISQSGNTDEVKQLIPLIKKMNNKIIAMTGNLDSYLSINSDCVLDLSIEKEACPNNLAPTTSTTMQLVMGDALAISLLRIKNFSKEDFARFHPGGVLGKRLNLTVKDICDLNNKPQVQLYDKLDKIIMEISSNRLGATAVIFENKIVGIITDGDLRRMLEGKIDMEHIKAVDLMTKDPKIINHKTLVFEAFSVMKKHNITQLLIIENQKYVGVIHLHDILNQNLF